MKTGFVLVAAVLLTAGAPLHATARDFDPVPVQIRIQNAVADAVLRCQVILAHFVTLADYRLAPGATRELALQRDQPSGALLVPREDGRLMAVENIYCGLDARWDETRAALDLSLLRDATREQVHLACSGGKPVMCREKD